MESRERLGYVNLLTGQQVDDAHLLVRQFIDNAIRLSAANTMPGVANFVGAGFSDLWRYE